ncbi:MAG: putative addiction module antidote protein [Candidatus Adiutrix sp.]|nr:putative addiction module antidote protein [Candidatus Adiutrix sp.]
MEEPDPNIFISALSTVSRLRGMTAVAKESGVNRESLYRTFSAGTKPRYETIVKLTRALGFSFSISPLPDDIGQIRPSPPPRSRPDLRPSSGVLRRVSSRVGSAAGVPAAKAK